MMKIYRYHLVILLLLLFRISYSQLPDIVAMEYYYDTDPGFSNGISVSITSDSLIEVTFDADMSSISNGFHILNVRVQDAHGNWSSALTEQVLKFSNPFDGTSGPLSQITQMEYFFDSDPGFGNGFDIPLTSDSLVDVVFDADFNTLSIGFHTLFVRTMDENGTWSTAFTSQVLKFSNPLEGAPSLVSQITEMEYFFDSDPGFGNGIDIPLSSDSLVEVVFDADFGSLSKGFHILFVRTKDETGKWSTAFTSQVLKFSNPLEGTPNTVSQITDMEYFFDNDPGFGNGFDIPITSDSLVEVVFDADFSSLSKGFHILFVRTKDETGIWSTAFTEQVFKFTNPAFSDPGLLPHITQMEYFFDADPGFGNGFAIPLTSDSLLQVVFDADFSTLSRGFHTFFVRVKDEYGNWNIAFTDDLYKFSNPEEAELLSLPTITKIEYFFDDDPGFGNGSEIIISPDTIIFENFLADITTIGTGRHHLFVRVMNEDRKWSQASVSSFCKFGLQVYLEGPYNISQDRMSTDLNSKNLLPLHQPFDTDTNAVWYYDGDESVAAIPNANVVDWLLLQARDATSPENATAETVKENQPAFLLNDGKIVQLDGESLISFTEPIDNELFLVVFHRNHTGVLSSAALNQVDDCECTYNFSTKENHAYGNNTAHKQIAPGVWAMYGGDGDANGVINTDDKVNLWIEQVGTPGYNAVDYNLNGEVDNQDKNDSWIENRNKSSQIPE